ncbi:hypothetical protein GF360_04110 [candidate division WWE3 bacterium]|nr:hypothetical protein [candidate division WWE3 bacterium]
MRYPELAFMAFSAFIASIATFIAVAVLMGNKDDAKEESNKAEAEAGNKGRDAMPSVKKENKK